VKTKRFLILFLSLLILFTGSMAWFVLSTPQGGEDAPDPKPVQPAPPAAKTSPPRVEEKETALSALVAHGRSQADLAAVAGTPEPEVLPDIAEEARAVGDPVVMVEPVLTRAWGPTEFATLERLRREFAEDMAGPNQDPNSREYLEKWKRAKARSDQTYVAQFGGLTFVLEQQAQSQRASQAAR
jgi:Na+-transporting methylmalonyl-CoA/oxaloacetate decarboxylase gamma subunit